MKLMETVQKDIAKKVLFDLKKLGIQNEIRLKDLCQETKKRGWKKGRKLAKSTQSIGVVYLIMNWIFMALP